jgi:hypothetical protein
MKLKNPNLTGCLPYKRDDLSTGGQFSSNVLSYASDSDRRPDKRIAFDGSVLLREDNCIKATFSLQKGDLLCCRILSIKKMKLKNPNLTGCLFLTQNIPKILKF